MKIIAKMAVGLTACAMAASAFAGGPEMAPPTIDGFNIGLGMGFKSYQFGQYITEWTAPFDYYANPYSGLNKFGPIGELGYTFQVGPMGFVGLRGYYEYDNVHFWTYTTNTQSYQSQVDLQSHVAAMLVGGLLLNANNAAYLEAGYTALWAKRILSVIAGPGSTATPPPFVTSNTTFNGGIVGVGWRHYFVPNVYLDLSYDFALYSNGGSLITAWDGATGTPTGTQASGLSKLQVNGVTATLNYLFQV